MTRTDDIEALARDALRLLNMVQPAMQRRLRCGVIDAALNGETPQSQAELVRLWNDVIARGTALFGKNEAVEVGR